MREGQEAHLRLVAAHKSLMTKYEKSKQIIEKMRDRVTEAESRATAAAAQLKEREATEPQKIHNAKLDQYKKVRTEGVEVPTDLVPLLEVAETEAVVDALIETVQSSQASRFDYLPLGRDSRQRREEILEQVDEDERKAREVEEVEDDPETAEDKKVIRSQLKR